MIWIPVISRFQIERDYQLKETGLNLMGMFLVIAFSEAVLASRDIVKIPLKLPSMSG
jgi:hypothetical protein